MYNVYVYVVYSYFVIAIFIRYVLNYTKKCKSNVCLSGKTAIITGGNKGLGYSLALALASRGCRVIIGCRRDEAETREKIEASTNSANIEVKHLDLMSLKSVRGFAQQINESEKRLDILVNNAGIGASNGEYTEDGLHPIMQTNHFGPFLLTHLLLDLMKKSASNTPSRIVFVGSALSTFNNLTEENLNKPSDNVTRMAGYCNSKLCNLITAKILAEKLKEHNITCNTVHLGLINTAIFKGIENAGVSKFLTDLLYKIVLNLIAKEPEEGIQVILNTAIANEVAGSTGEIFWDFGGYPRPSLIGNEEFCKKIWEKSAELVKLQPNETI